MTATELTTLLQPAGLPDDQLGEVIRLLALERACACNCGTCAAQRQSLLAVRYARDYMSTLRDVPVLAVGAAWMWMDRYSITDGKTQGKAVVKVEFSQGISAMGQLIDRPGELALYVTAAGEWSASEIHPGDPSHFQPRIVEPGAVYDLAAPQYWAGCPYCGTIDRTTWLYNHRPGVVVNKTHGGQQGVLGATCEHCEAFVPLDDWIKMSAATQATAPVFPAYGEVLEVDEL